MNHYYYDESTPQSTIADGQWIGNNQIEGDPEIVPEGNPIGQAISISGISHQFLIQGMVDDYTHPIYTVTFPESATGMLNLWLADGEQPTFTYTINYDEVATEYYTANSGLGARCKVEVISRSDLLRARGFKVDGD